MSSCPDCGNLMISQGEETFKGKQWIVLMCISCGSSIRTPKAEPDHSERSARWIRRALR